MIEFCGGYKEEPRKILMGGPMMGRAIFSDAMPIVKNNNAILAFSKAQSMVKEETSCINCGRCHQACPFGLIPTALAKAYEARDAQALSDLESHAVHGMRQLLLHLSGKKTAGLHEQAWKSSSKGGWN